MNTVFEGVYEYKTVVIKSDVRWLSDWGNASVSDDSYEQDNVINQFCKDGWKVHTINYGSIVHGGAGQLKVLFERGIAMPLSLHKASQEITDER